MQRFHLHLVSDATGETIYSVLRACLAQFDDVQALEHFWNMVRSPRQLEMVLENIAQSPGLVIYSLVDPGLRARLEQQCGELGVPRVPVLDPVLEALSSYLGRESRHQPGRQHALDAEYFERMEAVHFALAHDDGHNPETLAQADVVLVGVSRTSKTPTAIYLGNRGVRAANVPLVPDVPPPRELEELGGAKDGPLVVGLTASADRLLQIRRQRLRQVGERGETDYVDPDQIAEEVKQARRLFARRGWPVIDVTRRSIEETTAEILTLLSRRHAALPQGMPPHDAT